MIANPHLYNRLVSLFKNVKISKEGQGYGVEEYRICCPFCSDKRFRLYINSSWMSFDNRHDNPGLIHCFNTDGKQESCTDIEENVDTLKRMITGLGQNIVLLGNFQDSSRREESRANDNIDAKLPGECVDISELKDDHPAIRYLISRNYDKNLISDMFGVKYCTRPPDDMGIVGNRIIIPVIMRNKLMGWQARSINDYEFPKYFTMPGMKIKSCLYNYDNAAKNDGVIICEGVTDVWRVGDRAIATFGKSVSEYQLKMLIRWKYAIIFWDSDAEEECRNLSKKLSRYIPTYILTCSGYKDPGSMPTDLVNRLTSDAILFMEEAKRQQSGV